MKSQMLYSANYPHFDCTIQRKYIWVHICKYTKEFDLIINKWLQAETFILLPRACVWKIKRWKWLCWSRIRVGSADALSHGLTRQRGKRNERGRERVKDTFLEGKIHNFFYTNRTENKKMLESSGGWKTIFKQFTRYVAIIYRHTWNLCYHNITQTRNILSYDQWNICSF
jgi:hypothetical protein